jgi:hypothetical protein
MVMGFAVKLDFFSRKSSFVGPQIEFSRKAMLRSKALRLNSIVFSRKFSFVGPNIEV